MIQLPGGDRRPISGPEQIALSPDWAPDGRRLAFDHRGLVRLYHFSTGRVTTITAAQVLPQAAHPSLR